MSWDDLATTALVGTARRALETDALPAALTGLGPAATDDPQRLLELAALATVYRRAGTRPQAARPLPEPAAEDPRRVAAGPARARLAAVLQLHDDELLALWLTTAAARGLRPPDHLLPALLNRAVSVPSLAGPVAATVGARGAWLAARRPDWSTLLSRVPQPLPEDAWSVGTAGQRVAWLRARREADPGAARELLAGSWRQETPDQRAALLGTLATGLAPADEEFLEAALDDRRADVRAVAARLLALLPGSAYAARAAERALALVTLKRFGLRKRLVVTVPAPSAQLSRDLPAPRPPSADLPASAWLVRDLINVTPLPAWRAIGTPEQLTRSEVHDGWRAVLWSGWAAAAVRESDAGWARALLADPPAPGPAERGHNVVSVVGTARDLLEALPEPERAGVAAAMVARFGAGAVPLLSATPAPWPDALAQAVLDHLAANPKGSYETWPVLNVAHRMPSGFAVRLRELADRLPAESPLPRRLHRAADQITFRDELLQELQ